MLGQTTMFYPDYIRGYERRRAAVAGEASVDNDVVVLPQIRPCS